jgi:hypothetical protein
MQSEAEPLTAEQPEQLAAEQRFRDAFNRLKNGDPNILPKGTIVSQNNVAKEAGRKSCALRKSRYPSLVREIQAFVEIHGQDIPSNRQTQNKNRKDRKEQRDLLTEVSRQRDFAQSQLTSANRCIVEFAEIIKQQKLRIDELQSPVKLLHPYSTSMVTGPEDANI